MARKRKSTSASSTDFEEQLRQLDRKNARLMADRLEQNERAFSVMVERQQEMLANFYKASSEAGRQSIRADMEERQQKMKEQLDSMKKSFALYSQFMTKTEKKAFEQMYSTSVEGMDRIGREMNRRFDGLDDDFEELTESFSEKINRVFEELRDLSVALNISDMANGLEDSVDSYVKNLREARSYTNDFFDDSLFSSTVSQIDKSLSALGRDETSELVVSMIKEFRMKNLDEISTYAQTIASADIMGISKDDMSKIMWKDMDYGQNGRWMRNISNMAVSLGENEDLYISSNIILSGIASNIDAIYGLAGRDSKKATNMVKSLAAIQALEETAALDGVSTLSSILTDWSGMSKPEFYEDDRAVNFASLLGMSIDELYQSVRDPAGLEAFMTSFQNRIDDMSEFQLHSFTEALGFEKDYQLMEIAGYEDLVPTLDTINDTIEKSFIDSDQNAGLDLMKNASDSTIGAVDEFKKSIGSSGVGAFLSDILAELDIGFAEVVSIGNAALGIFNIVKGAKSGKGILGKAFRKLSGYFRGSGKVSSNSASYTADEIAKAMNTSTDDVISTFGKAASYTAEDVAKVMGSSVDDVANAMKGAGFVDDAARASSGASKIAGTLGKTGKALGIIGTALEAGITAYEAYNAYKSGDKRRGASEIGEGIGSIAGGATAGIAVGAALAATGIGAIPGAIIAGVSAIAGGLLGGAGGKAVGGAVHDVVADFKPFSDEQLEQIESYYNTVSELYDTVGTEAAKNFTLSTVVPYLNSLGISTSITDKYKRDTGKPDFMKDYEKEKFLGYYRDGISFVPYDGLAMIHKGEAVLTREQADNARVESDGGIPIALGRDSILQSIFPLYGVLSGISDKLGEFYDSSNMWKMEEESNFKRSLQTIRSKLLSKRSSLYSGDMSYLLGSMTKSLGATGILGLLPELGTVSKDDTGTGDVQISLVHDNGMIVPEKDNPLNSSATSVTVISESDDSSETVETLKWMVYRLEAKLDKLISVSSSENRRNRISTSEDMNRAYSL